MILSLDNEDMKVQTEGGKKYVVYIISIRLQILCLIYI